MKQNYVGTYGVLKDISNKKVDVVIVKDLSRLSRNYIEFG